MTHLCENVHIVTLSPWNVTTMVDCNDVYKATGAQWGKTIANWNPKCQSISEFIPEKWYVGCYLHILTLMENWLKFVVHEMFLELKQFMQLARKARDPKLIKNKTRHNSCFKVKLNFTWFHGIGIYQIPTIYQSHQWTLQYINTRMEVTLTGLLLNKWTIRAGVYSSRRSGLLWVGYATSINPWEWRSPNPSIQCIWL